jgi:hypothetical protein
LGDGEVADVKRADVKRELEAWEERREEQKAAAVGTDG